jgi:hypothetical protein
MTSSALSNILDPGSWYSDAQILHIRTSAFEEASKYFQTLEKKVSQLESQLQLAESLIPHDRHHTYLWLSEQPSYGGSDPD